MIKISLQISIETYLDDAEARKQQAELEAKNEKIAAAIDANEKATKEAYNKAMGAMRASYQIISGFTQILGGSMGAAFGAIYGVGYAAITMYQAIAAAQFFVPGMQMQSILMTMSLVSAMISLGGVIVGQMELANKVNGIQQMLVGINGLMGAFNW